MNSVVWPMPFRSAPFPISIYITRLNRVATRNRTAITLVANRVMNAISHPSIVGAGESCVRRQVGFVRLHSRLTLASSSDVPY